MTLPRRKQIDRLLRPRSVAVIGASSDPTKVAGMPIRFLAKHGFAGTVYPVNPRFDSLAGHVCYRSVRELPEAPDAAIVMLGASKAEEAVRDLSALGCPAAIVVASGFGETDAQGKARQLALREAAGDMAVLGPNTIGCVNVTNSIVLSASGALAIDDIRRGAVSLVSQSGGILGSLLSRMTARGVGFSRLVATGNESDLEVSDFIDWLIDDDETRVIALYLETLRDPARFIEVAARAVRAGKPVVAFKVGRSSAGMRSAASHTGALSSPDQVYDAVFRKAGVIRAKTFAEFVDLPAVLATGKRMAGTRVAILTSSGGAGALLADACGIAGLELPVPDGPTVEKLARVLVGDGSLPDRNPVDLTLAGLRHEVFLGSISALLESPSYDGVVVVAGSSSIARPQLITEAMSEALHVSSKPLLAYASPNAPNVVISLNAAGVPCLDAPEAVAAALLALRPASLPALPAVAATAPPLPDLHAGPLNEVESRMLFAKFGLAGPRELVVRTPADADAAARSLGDTHVVLKVLAREIAHKSDVGGVLVDVPAKEASMQATLMQRTVRNHTDAPIEGYLVQEMVTGGVEMILGFSRDPQLGGSILIGAGGVSTELYNDTCLRLPPVGQVEASEMVAAIRASALLYGFRGRPRADVDALVGAICRFSDMVVALGERLLEAEINPLLVLPEGRGVCAVDGLVVLR